MVRTISFFRHAKTGKPAANESDFSRRLTDEGKDQARRRRKLLGNPSFDAGFCSPRERTRETLHLLAGTDQIPTTTVAELFHDEDSDDGKLLNAAFEVLGYAGVGDYMRKSDAATQAALTNYGKQAWRSLTVAMEILPEKAIDVIVVGHAVLLGLIIHAALAATTNKLNATGADEVNFGECEGARLTFDEAGACIRLEIFQG